MIEEKPRDGPSGMINSRIPSSPHVNATLFLPTLNDLSGDGVERLDVGVARPDAVHHRQAEPPVPAKRIKKRWLRQRR